MVGSVLLRLLIQGAVADFGQAILAVVLAGTFVLVSQDPTDQPGATKPRGSRYDRIGAQRGRFGVSFRR